MFKNMGKKRVDAVLNSKIVKESKDVLTLEDVVGLGGNKADFELVCDVLDENEILNHSEDLDAEPIKKSEIHAFIKEIGLDKEMEQDEDDMKASDAIKTIQPVTTSPAADDDDCIKAKENLPIAQDATAKKSKKKKNKFKIQDEEISSTSVDEVKVEKSDTSTLDRNKILHLDFLNSYNKRNYLLVKPGGKWFDSQLQKTDQEAVAAENSLITKLKKYTENLMNDEVDLYKKHQLNSKTSDAKWIRTVLKSGTLADRTAALTLMVQESPLHNLFGLETLINMVKKKGHREALAALDSVKELWLSDLLPDDRKLRRFEENPLTKVEELASGNKDTRDRRLLLWYYEDNLKDKYETFVKSLQAMTHDQLTVSKKRSLDSVLQLLVKKPEQERQLLETISNKIGDPDNKISTQATHLLTKLVEEHPKMKTVVCEEIERLLYRQNISPKAQYFAVCFLNQLILHKSEKNLAAKLIGIYFSFFKLFSEKKKKIETKMLSALLTGVNRAFPYAKVDIRSLDTELNNLYKTVHTSQFNTGIQSLMLLFHVVDASDSIMCDRYYSALYKKLLDPELQTSSRQAMFLNLLFKSMKKDDSKNRMKAFIKRLLQQCCHMSPTFICGALVLLSEILQLKPELLDIVKINAQLDSQILDDTEDDDEHFTDVKEDDDNSESSNDNSVNVAHEDEVKKALSEKGHTTAPSTWIHRKNTGRKDQPSEYNPLHRNPMYCHAEMECVWELRKLKTHYHPTIVLFAETLLKGLKIEYTGNPLQDFSLIRFLDRFVYRNPKKKEKVIQNALDPRSKTKRLEGIQAMAVNDENYALLDEASVPVEEKFFYKYFKHYAVKKKTVAADQDSDEDSIDDDEFDDYLDKFEQHFDGAKDGKFDFAGEFDKQIKKTKIGSLESDSDDDDDLDMDDLSDEEIDFGDDFKPAEDFDEEELGDIDGEGEWEDVAPGDNDDSDENMDFGEEDSDDEHDDQDPGFNEEDISFSDDDGVNQKMNFSKSNKKKKKKDDGFPNVKASQGKSAGGNLVAAAEEFGNLMDDNAGMKFDLTGTEAMSNKDNAHVKQLRWESDRDKWVRGQDWKSKHLKQGQGKRRKFHPDKRKEAGQKQHKVSTSKQHTKSQKRKSHGKSFNQPKTKYKKK